MTRQILWKVGQKNWKINWLNYSSRMSVINNELTCLALTWLRAAERPSAIGVVRRTGCPKRRNSTQLDVEWSWVELCRYKRGLRCMHTQTSFSLTDPFFQVRLLRVRPVPKSKLLRIIVAELLQAGCPCCRPTNSMKALKVCAVKANIDSLKQFSDASRLWRPKQASIEGSSLVNGLGTVSLYGSAEWSWERFLTAASGTPNSLERYSGADTYMSMDTACTWLCG